MNKLLEKYKSLVRPKGLTAAAVGICVFLFWLFAYPQALSYQEQYQLFLWTGDYFCEEMKTAGGLAQYLGEFLVQFYIYEALGALLLGVVFATITYLMTRLLDKAQVVMAAIPALLLLWHMGDENVLMAYPVAIILALLSYLVLKKVHFLADIIILPVMFWLIGPMVWLYAGLRTKDWKGLIGIVYLIAVQFGCANLVLAQWPLQNVMFGMWYYRYEDLFSVMQIAIPVVILIIAKCGKYLTFDKKYIFQIATLCILAFLAVKQGYDKDKYELIKQDYLIRNERWNEVVKNAENYTVPTPFWSECVNLSLAMTGQLSNRMFAFYQSGEEALIMRMLRDLTSNLPSMEAFYRLGMTNECMRYAFDLQESIPLGKKSGRLTRRIVECCIVSGRYDVAKKHIGLLKKSLFYRQWAEKAEKCIENETWINTHPQWGKMRQYEFDNDFLYYFPEISKVFYHLFVSNTDNRLAMEYMLGQLLLEGNRHVFSQMVGVGVQYGHYTTIPYTYQDAYQCMQGQPIPGSRYIEYAKRMSDLENANAPMSNEESVH